MGIPELETFFIRIMCNDYMKYTFCRKQFSLSANMTEIWLKLGGKYYPQKPILGHAGNIAQSSGETRTNKEFMLWVSKCFGTYYNCEKDININPLNFAVNDRFYDPADLK